MKKPDLVGIAEIAEMAGVSRQVVHAWTRRARDMPKPLARLKMGPVWDRGEVRKWLAGIGFTHLQGFIK